MPIAVESTVQAIAAMVQRVTVGTNLALLHPLWAMVNGSFLRTRGAVFGAPWASSFAVSEVRRRWAALRTEGRMPTSCRRSGTLRGAHGKQRHCPAQLPVHIQGQRASAQVRRDGASSCPHLARAPHRAGTLWVRR